MKKILIYTIVAVCAGLVAMAYTKSENEPPAVEVSTMVDITDTLRCLPDTSSIFPLLNISEAKWKSYKFRSQNISNYDYNPIHSCNLSSSFALLDNPIKRSEQISRFKHEITTCLDAVNDGTGTLPKSSVYLPIIREINRLAKSQAKEKILVVYSDLIENTSSFSLYKQKTYSEKIQESLVAYFRRVAQPCDLTNVSVFFIFRPRNDEEHAKFKCMSNMYKQLLEEAHTHVYIGANIVPQF